MFTSTILGGKLMQMSKEEALKSIEDFGTKFVELVPERFFDDENFAIRFIQTEAVD
jgi:hypothetical protein